MGLDCVSLMGGVPFSERVSESSCLWGVFCASIRRWSWCVLAASGVMPRARNSLVRGMLTVARKR